MPPLHDIAHVGHVEIRTPVPAESLAFFTRDLGLTENASVGDSVFLRAWDDYENATIKLTAHATSGIGRTNFRAASPEALERQVAQIEATGRGIGWQDGDVVYTRDRTGTAGRLHHIAFATDTREDILRAADIALEQGVFIETGPHKHAIQQTFFLYVDEPGGNRVELCNAGARLVLAPDWQPVDWTEAERAKGQAWGLKTIASFHTHGTPPVET